MQSPQNQLGNNLNRQQQLSQLYYSQMTPQGNRINNTPQSVLSYMGSTFQFQPQQGTPSLVGNQSGQGVIGNAVKTQGVIQEVGEESLPKDKENLVV